MRAVLQTTDMAVECVLERFELERIANKLGDRVLSETSKVTSDGQFLNCAGIGNANVNTRTTSSVNPK